MYLKMTSKVGDFILPDITQRALSASILDLQVEMEQAADIQRDLAKVGRDDIISPDEVPIFNSCVDQLKLVCGAIFAIAYTPLAKEKVTCVGAQATLKG
jgi:hypothetical protein